MQIRFEITYKKQPRNKEYEPSLDRYKHFVPVRFCPCFSAGITKYKNIIKLQHESTQNSGLLLLSEMYCIQTLQKTLNTE